MCGNNSCSSGDHTAFLWHIFIKPLKPLILKLVLNIAEFGTAQELVLFYHFLKDTEEDLMNERMLNT